MPAWTHVEFPLGEDRDANDCDEWVSIGILEASTVAYTVHDAMSAIIETIPMGSSVVERLTSRGLVPTMTQHGSVMSPTRGFREASAYPWVGYRIVFAERHSATSSDEAAPAAASATAACGVTSKKRVYTGGMYSDEQLAGQEWWR